MAAPERPQQQIQRHHDNDREQAIPKEVGGKLKRGIRDFENRIHAAQQCGKSLRPADCRKGPYEKEARHEQLGGCIKVRMVALQ